MSICGNIERPGGMISWVLPSTGLIEDFFNEIPVTDEMKKHMPGGDRFKMGAARTCNPDSIIRDLNKGEKPIRVWISVGGQQIVHLASTRAVVEGLKKVDFLVQVDQFWGAMAEMADIAAELVHFTGYERPVKTIRVPSLRYRLLGNFLGSADIIAQMADRCYLEKCRDRLYPEFVTGGLAAKKNDAGDVEVVFSSGEDLLRKTPGFYAGATRRLKEDLGNGLEYAGTHFGGQNLYVESAEKNMRFAEMVRAKENFSLLKRAPPETLFSQAAERKAN